MYTCSVYRPFHLYIQTQYLVEVCTHTHIRTYIPTYISIYLYIYIYTCICLCVGAYDHVYTHTQYVYVYTLWAVCIHTYTYGCTYVCMYVGMYVFMYVFTYNTLKNTYTIQCIHRYTVLGVPDWCLPPPGLAPVNRFPPSSAAIQGFPQAGVIHIDLSTMSNVSCTWKQHRGRHTQRASQVNIMSRGADLRHVL